MAGVVSDHGELQILYRALIVAGDPDWRVRLYTNDHTPGEDDEADDYDEATFSGYADQDLQGWSAPATVDGVAKTIADSVTFQAASDLSGSENVYGYYVTDSANGGALVYAERFAGAPLLIALPNQTLVILPSLTASTP